MDSNRRLCYGRELGVGCDRGGVGEREVMALTAVQEIMPLLYFPDGVEVVMWW